MCSKAKDLRFPMELTPSGVDCLPSGLDSGPKTSDIVLLVRIDWLYAKSRRICQIWGSSFPSQGVVNPIEAIFLASTRAGNFKNI